MSNRGEIGAITMTKSIPIATTITTITVKN